MSNISEFHCESKLLVIEPGNCTLYLVQISTCTGPTVSEICGYGSQRGYIITVLNHDCKPFIVSANAGILHASYFAQKTNLGEGDAEALVPHIARKIGFDWA